MAEVWKTYEIGKLKFNSEVEIIIPFQGKHAQVTFLLESIFKSVNIPYFITLVDDGSENTEFIAQINESKLPNVRCMRHDAQEGLGAALNSALANPSKITSWVVLMCSNAIVEGQWLQELGICIQSMKDQGVKMVSPRSDIIGGNLPVFKKEERVDTFILNKDQFLPFYCAFCHRDLFKKIKFFKESSNFFQEFAERMHKNGFLQGICGKSWVGQQK